MATKKQRISGFLKRNFPRVEKVIDARKGLRIIVKKRDCAHAKSKEPMSCALAVAVKRKYKSDGAIIGMSASYIIRGKKAVRFITPKSVQRELVSFDRHHDFAPGIYPLSPVSRSITAEGRADRRKNKPSSGKHPKRFVHKATARVRSLK